MKTHHWVWKNRDDDNMDVFRRVADALDADHVLSALGPNSVDSHYVQRAPAIMAFLRLFPDKGLFDVALLGGMPQGHQWRILECAGIIVEQVAGPA